MLARFHAKGEKLDEYIITKSKTEWKVYLYEAIPAMLDMIATTMSSYGLIFIDVSIM